MPRYSDEQRKTHSNMIRRVMVQLEAGNEYPSVLRIQGELERNGQHFHQDYINAHKNKIYSERANRIDNKILSTELAKVEDRFNEMTRRLYRILQDETSSARDRVNAARAIAEMEKSLMSFKFDAGVFKRKLGTLDVNAVTTFVDLIKMANSDDPTIEQRNIERTTTPNTPALPNPTE